MPFQVCKPTKLEYLKPFLLFQECSAHRQTEIKHIYLKLQLSIEEFKDTICITCAEKNLNMLYVHVSLHVLLKWMWAFNVYSAQFTSAKYKFHQTTQLQFGFVCADAASLFYRNSLCHFINGGGSNYTFHCFTVSLPIEKSNSVPYFLITL